jgi:hypothetical protein
MTPPREQVKKRAVGPELPRRETHPNQGLLMLAGTFLCGNIFQKGSNVFRRSAKMPGSAELGVQHSDTSRADRGQTGTAVFKMNRKE